MRTAKSLGIPVLEIPYTVDELLAADEIIVSASSNLARPVISVDGIPTGGKNPTLLKSLQDRMLADYLEKTT